jgi:hypothetical protein
MPDIGDVTRELLEANKREKEEAEEAKAEAVQIVD